MSDKKSSTNPHPFDLSDPKESAKLKLGHVHRLKEGFRCVTDTRGQANPKGMSKVELLVDATEGFVPLWGPNTILRWQFADGTLTAFKDPDAAGRAIEAIFGKALLAWGDAAPVKFTKNTESSDFEIVVLTSDDCDPNGCVLASAFFPCR